METKWIIVANASSARIFSMNTVHKLILIKELNHPESRKKDSELMSGSLGRYKVRGGAGGGNFSSRTDPKKSEVDHFAKELAELLEHGRTTNDFDSIILVTPPTFHGLLNKHFTPYLLAKISKVIPKDYPHMNERELLDLLKE
jgi:protein required for attachment to host cells